jgi:hypothetical protein
MESQRPSRTTTGNPIHLTFRATVEVPTSDALPLTQDGGKSSDTKVLMLSMRKERLLKSRVDSIMKTETSLSETETIRSTNNGILFTLMNGRENQLRDNSTRDSDSMLKETSTSNLNFQTTDISISSIIGTWSSRFQTAEEPKSGISTNNL